MTIPAIAPPEMPPFFPGVVGMPDVLAGIEVEVALVDVEDDKPRMLTVESLIGVGSTMTMTICFAQRVTNDDSVTVYDVMDTKLPVMVADAATLTHAEAMVVPELNWRGL